VEWVWCKNFLWLLDAISFVLVCNSMILLDLARETKNISLSLPVWLLMWFCSRYFFENSLSHMSHLHLYILSVGGKALWSYWVSRSHKILLSKLSFTKMLKKNWTKSGFINLPSHNLLQLYRRFDKQTSGWKKKIWKQTLKKTLKNIRGYFIAISFIFNISKA
jgi:hypothetical protein